ncbi:MAG TPA: tRNA (guanosine(37)-N1)-methyltransferase TrmD [Firmicutes bacterium]|nr:tRNA (guanosine(37)-N1)-methyltransferase TrmD [Bacillota bacterium]
MRIDILTLFPQFFSSIFATSILQRAVANELVLLNTVDIRDFAYDKHRIVDDYPYGGGAGMVMKPEPIARAIAATRQPQDNTRVIYMSPQGQVFNQEKALELASFDQLVILCGHYEGVDERVIERYVDEEISIGDFVLTGGELPAAVLVDAVVRLLPGVLGSSQSAAEDSFSDGLLEYPQYTRPPEFEGLTVPEVLLSGHHGKIAAWRRQESLRRTLERRPDLLAKASLTKTDQAFLKQLQSLTN